MEIKINGKVIRGVSSLKSIEKTKIAQKVFKVNGKTITANVVRRRPDVAEVKFSFSDEGVKKIFTVSTWDILLYWSNVDQDEVERVYKLYEFHKDLKNYIDE